MSLNKKVVWLPYDMDTAIGINNEGQLVFGYQLEDIDQTTSGANIFNGQDSVIWKNIRAAFSDQLKTMYQELRSNGRISYAIVERMFRNHQSKWPEALFNEDERFKYIDPFTDNNQNYLGMLLGSKAEQRKWWLYNRFRYMDSKYIAGDAKQDTITIRPYGAEDITLTPYADIYATILWDKKITQERTPRNTPVTLNCPYQTMNDNVVTIYSASQLASIGDLSPLQVGTCDISKAVKINGLKIGDSDSNYDNGNLRSLTLGNNILLQTLDARNCSGLGDTTKEGHTQTTVDISGCSIVENVYFSGTKIQGVTLPNGGILKVLDLPETITNLTVLNQPAITTFSVTNNDYSNISTLRIQNCSNAIPVLDILEDMTAGGRVRIVGLNKTADSVQDIEDFLDKLDTMRGLDENGNNLEHAVISGTIHMDSLTGAQLAAINNHINSSGYYITITYNQINSILTYKTWDGSQTIDTQNIVNGGNGTKINNIARSSTAQYNFTPDGWSTEINGQKDDNALVHVTADRIVYAAYSKEKRKYTVRFLNWDNTVLQTQNDVEYGTSVTYTGSTPTREGEWEFTYFSPDGTQISGNTDCIAQYRSTAIVTPKYVRGTLKDESLYAIPHESEISTIGDYAFYNYNKLYTLDNSYITTIRNGAFQSCTSLSSINLPNVVSIGDYAFSSCFSLNFISCPNANYIGMGAFYNCRTLTSVDFPSVISIGSSAFASCPSLASVNFSNASYIGSRAFGTCQNLTSISFPNVITIGSGAFEKCSSLTSISFPNVTAIESYTFGKCTALTSVNFPNLINISFTAFESCTSLTSISCPNATIIEEYAFGNCTALTSISFPSVITIGKQCFADCTSLTIANFPSATNIGNIAFNKCSSLTSISFPNVISIGDYAFQSCTALTSISFPNVITIGSQAFTFCTSLESIYLLNSSFCSIKLHPFFSTPIANSSYLGYYGSIFVPASLVDTYKSATNWTVYSSRITAYLGGE